MDKLNKCTDKDLLECLYVKVEKDKHKEYTLANYQYIIRFSLCHTFGPLSKKYKIFIS